MKIWKHKWNRKTAAAAFALAFAAVSVFGAALAVTGITGDAAGAAKIEIKETSVDVSLGQTVNVNFTYQMPEGTAAQLDVVIADETAVNAAVVDNGNGSAVLSVAGLQIGSCVVAVYEASDPNVVDYVTVKCGMAEAGKVYTLNEGSAYTTVYDDRVVEYNSLMNAQSGDQLAVSHLEVQRNSGIDGLLVKGSFWQQNTSSAGLLKFYANFYNASGELIERMPYYVRNTGAGGAAELLWYIPEGCTRIVLE